MTNLNHICESGATRENFMNKCFIFVIIILCRKYKTMLCEIVYLWRVFYLEYMDNNKTWFRGRLGPSSACLKFWLLWQERDEEMDFIVYSPYNGDPTLWEKH